jgi:hypothetical protein
MGQWLGGACSKSGLPGPIQGEGAKTPLNSFLSVSLSRLEKERDPGV